MKKFAFKIFYFLSPLWLILIIHLYFDPFKIIYSYKDPYKNSYVAMNRSYICNNIFESNKDRINYNAFIFGSSRSQAFYCKNWQKKLPPNSHALHFDSSGESIFGIASKLKYLERENAIIEYALLILDNDILPNTEESHNFFMIQPPQISQRPWSEYYSAYLKAGCDLTFLLAYVDISLFKTYRPYMGVKVRMKRYFDKLDPLTADIYYGGIQEIRDDSVAYYDKLIKMGVFYDRSKRKRNIKFDITNKEVKLLKDIKKVFDRNHTNYKIIYAPTYDQNKLDPDRAILISQIFDAKNIYDFSGKNKFTESIGNYFEDSHFRPHVANDILDSVYQSK